MLCGGLILSTRILLISAYSRPLGETWLYHRCWISVFILTSLHHSPLQRGPPPFCTPPLFLVSFSFPFFSWNLCIYDLFLYTLATPRTFPIEETLSGPAARHVSCAICPELPSQKGPGLSLMLYCCHLDILHPFCTRGSTFLFCTGLQIM